ncbi:hypothetical protein [Microcoleus sp.]
MKRGFEIKVRSHVIPLYNGPEVGELSMNCGISLSIVAAVLCVCLTNLLG